MRDIPRTRHHGHLLFAFLPGTVLAPTRIMPRRVVALFWICVAGVNAVVPLIAGQTERVHDFRIEVTTGRLTPLRQRFTDAQLEILEKVNRADLEHLAGLRTLVVPERWADDELAYSVLPERYPSAERHDKALVVHVPGQAFGAYESGQLVHWGPVSTGTRATPTPEGLFFLNWKAIGHTSTVNPEWFMRWYFNFGNREGLAFHEYALPGLPASHGCIRMLQRDAKWLFTWGDEWVLDTSGKRLIRAGTPVFIVGSHDFRAQPPWRSPDWLAQTVSLPPFPIP